ncbi:hypothetical protein [Micrococcus luteus]|uniref:hypothetical protein n=1 Tax=Micrococcus luteus TaxID=1270 RepID=UPI0011C07EFC|nr:hypothetical protein [Micrococcus luteus]
MSKFVTMSKPYLDFAVVNFSRTCGHRVSAAETGPLADLGLSQLSLHHTDGSWSWVVTSDPARVRHDAGRLALISGLARTPQKLLVPLDAPTWDEIDEVDPAAGQFSLLEVGDGRSHIRTDMFGLGLSFASQHQEAAIGSNRLHLHKIVLELLGFPVRLDETAVASLLFSDSSFFSQQTTLKQTLIHGVELVPVTHDTVFEDGKVSFAEKSIHRSISSTSPADYSSLLASGVDEVIDNSRVALDSDQFTARIVDLSGGKDSRMVFGSVLHVEGWKERTSVYTKDIVGTDDLPIAAGLANAYGAAFYDGDDTNQSPLTLDENLEFWRSYFFGQYNRFGPGGWSNKGTNLSTLTLSGGLGELFRVVWPTQFRRHLSGSTSERDFADALVYESRVAGAYGEDAVRQVADAFADDLSRLPGESLGERVDSHYLFNRNRFHFGLRAFSSYHEHLTWFPLAAASLFSAARTVPYADRNSNKVVFDVLEAFDPYLTRVRFDGADPFEHVTTRSRLPRLHMDERTDRWKAATDNATSRVAGRRAGQRPAMVWSQMAPFVRDAATSALTALRSAPQVPESCLPEGLESRLADSFDASVSKGYSLAVRILAVHDAIMPSQA